MKSAFQIYYIMRRDMQLGCHHMPIYIHYYYKLWKQTSKDSVVVYTTNTPVSPQPVVYAMV